MDDIKQKTKRLLELQDLLVKFIEVERLIYLPDGKITDRKENNAEHSYSLAIAAWFLSSKYPHLDRDLIIRYALIHDIVEVHAGDEMAIGRTEEAEKQKSIREQKALNLLVADWPDFEDMTSHIDAYEERSDGESRFVYALDKIMPMLLNILSDGKTWKLYGFEADTVIASKDDKIKISPEIDELWQIFRQQILADKSLFNN